MVVPRAAHCLAISAATFFSGCTSSSSTFLLRDESNSCWQTTCTRGVPITVKVPTHVKMYVYEKHYLQVLSVGGVNQVQYLKLPPMRDFAQEYIYTEKVVTVDFKRPAAGPFNLNVKFTADQYLDQVQQDLTDETIFRVGEFLSTIGATFKPSLGNGDGKAVNIDDILKEVKSVVAVGIFEVDAPDFEQQVKTFLDGYLNKCNETIFSASPAGEAPPLPAPAQTSAATRAIDATQKRINEVALTPNAANRKRHIAISE